MDGERQDIKISLDIKFDNSSIDWNPIDEIINKLSKIKNSYQDKYDSIIVVTDYDDGDINFIFYGIRKENDEEYERRITYQKHWKNEIELERKNKEEKDRIEFERMKEVYGW